MAIMIGSKKYLECLNIFIFGYSRFDVKKQGRKIFSMWPLLFIPILVIIILIYLLFRLPKNNGKTEELDLECFLTKRNEGVLISESENDEPGLLTCKKEELSKYISIALDKHVIEHGETPNHIFFILDKDDFDAITPEVLEVLRGKHIWIFIQNNCTSKTKNWLTRIGKVILFDPDYMETCGYSRLVLGIVPRFLSLISRNGDTNLNHIQQGIPDISTFSFSYPIDLHKTTASLIKHQKYLLKTYNDDCFQITNCENIVEYLPNPAKYVESETESFYVCFRGAL
jgi:hypothetical protein